MGWSHAGWSGRVAGRLALCLVAVATLGPLLAAANEPAAERYRLAHSGSHWDVVGSDRVFDDLRPRYAEFFELILDPAKTGEPDIRPVRDDLEHTPVDRRNFDALNTVAIAYFEINYRAEAGRGEGLAYLGLSQRAAKLVALPWRAYAETESAALRDAILDFFEDAGSGEKLHSAATAPRLARIVESLEKKEDDPARRARIRALSATLQATGPPE
jgi:hypothetical protein